jgi:hypothetical protein
LLLVFNDLVMTVEQDKGKIFGKPKQNRWRVSPPSEGGVCRILEAKDWSGWRGEQEVQRTTNWQLRTPEPLYVDSVAPEHT